ncbi:efflux RND transporter periplasmic adaptor subunit [Lacisediminimonas profundi]|uniref:efflux RND transporter periplasmic adaptor subunit n=1 Tax=Lacisediminimonas profundi TaxID=2603856 RepID=UPI00124B336D|nr:efflux RND transporter periplasmic adaptor subunit [Lacisediminimonas profundi]
MDRRDPAADSRTSASRKGKFPLGTVIALLSVALLAALVWYLTSNAGKAKPGAPGTAQTASTGASAAGAAGAPGAAGAAGGGARPAGAGGGRAAATTVGVARAESADIPVQVDALGTVTSPAMAIVRAQVSGVLQKIHYTEGQAVKAGQLLAQIDPRPFEMALMQASGQRQRDEAQLDNARVLLKRFSTLLEQDSIARQEVEAQAALVRQLEGTVMTDRANEGTARLNLGYTRVTAPIAGRVGLRSVDLGNITGPNDANGLVTITQVAPIDVVFAVPQDQLPALRQQLKAADKMTVTAWDRDRTRLLATGRFLALDNQIDAQTGTARAKARFTNEDSTLFPGQFVNVRLQLRTIADTVLVPISALRHGSSGDYVYVFNPETKTVKLRPVQAGRIVGDKVQIVSGVKPGWPVITEGADRLRDGSPVNLPGDRPGARGMRGQGGAGQAGQATPAGTAANAGAQAAPAAGSAAAAAAPSAAPAGPAAAGSQRQSSPADAAAPAREQRRRPEGQAQ